MPPNKVAEIKSESLGTLQVLARDDAMVLFAPPYNSNDKRAVYEIILQRPTSDSNTSSFSLYRSPLQQDAEEKFNTFMQRLPVFVGIVKEVSHHHQSKSTLFKLFSSLLQYYSVNGLQKVCDALSENPSWTLAHLVAYFNLLEYISNPKVVQCIDIADHTTLMSPFQLAIKQGHIEMVKVLLPFSKMEHLDINSNSVFHYAASTSKEIINVSVDIGKEDGMVAVVGKRRS